MLFLALRHLLSKRRQTLLTLVGILMGTAAYVAISGMMMGFQTFIIDQLVNNDAHLRITAREELVTEESMRDAFFPPGTLVQWLVPPSGRRDYARIEYPQGWFERLDADPRVVAYSPQIVSQVIVTRAKATASGRLIGSDPTRQVHVTNIEDYMLEGKFSDLGQTGNRVVVGDGLLRKLGARVSETLLISVGKGSPTPFKVVGRFLLGVKGIDDTTLFGALHDVQNANFMPSQITDIAVRLSDVTAAAQISDHWAALSPEKVQSWDQSNGGILSVFKTQDIVRNSMTVSILIVAGFGIYNILSMAVSQKRREIAILRSIGYEPRDILKLFFFQGLILGALGGLVGVLFGYGISLFMSTLEVSPNRGLGTGKLMVSFSPLIYVKAFFLAFAASSIAAFLPARAAGRLTPIDIIRSEDS